MYVVPDYGIAHSPHGPHAFRPCAIGDGRFIRTQEYRTETMEHTYHQPVPTPQYAAFPTAAIRTPATAAQSLAYTNGLFVPGGLQQTVPVASERGVAWNQSVQATISPMKFQGHTMLPKEQPRRPAPWKQQFSGGAMVPTRLPHARQASQHSPQVAVPSVQSSPQTNLSYKNVSNAGPDLRSQPYARSNSYANRRMNSVSQHNRSKAKMPVGSMSSEIILKSYTSRILIGNPGGKIVIRTTQYNRADFSVACPKAKFFVIKSYNEADIHKSIKYGVWSTSFVGNQKLDAAFREAQAIAANSPPSTCPVFLFFSVNGSSNFCGVAEMVGPVDYQNDMDFWAQGSVLDDFMVHEEEEARSRQLQKFKLRRCAPHFIPAWHGPRPFRPVLPNYDSVLMDRVVSETNNLTDKLQNLKLDRLQGSSQELGNLASEASATNTQKESHCYGNQAHENRVKAIPSPTPTYQPMAKDVKSASDGEQPCWKKVENIQTGKPKPETVASVLSKGQCEEHPKEGKVTLAPEVICEEQKIVGNPCSPVFNSMTSKACSKPLPGVVAIGSMLIQITASN
ncbi:hypothetical protein HU200_019601 [Digitaria exilis]|uniref:YTH domain-containing family protein n=1 Tax=Digitaria exilis TaxID=1010633 RepID=A0A835F3S7_9POAL|nr:hypothetical protein HU200_019601 [Digitaria exilis]